MCVCVCLCNEFLSYAGNVKALFRRGKAHVGAWNPEEAKSDFSKVLQIDLKLKNAVNKELAELNKLQTERDREDRAKLAGKLIR